jgi:EAL and modified HD-GYP domain-containing signal transduction protein
MQDSNKAVLLARQPILDINLNLYAYELLFRGDFKNESGVGSFNGDLATSQVISHTFLELGIERVIGKEFGFLNLTRSFLTGEISVPFDNKKIVLEVLEDIEIDEQIIQGVKDLASQGFVIALDDFIFHEDLRPLIEIASIIKIDLLALSEQELIEHVEELNKYDVKLLAEKVETNEQFELCKSLGFDYFQGYFFCKPTILNDNALPDSKMTIMRVVSSLQNPDISIDDLEKLIALDASLSYKLLRLLNSPATGLPKQVESIRQGLVFLGLQKIKSWSTLIAFSNADSTPDVLMNTGLLRAKLCEQLAPHFNCDPESGFLVGLFSILEAIMQKPLPELLASLPLEQEINQALLHNEGQLGKLLTFIQYYEQNFSLNDDSPVSIEELNASLTVATEWAIQASSEI